MVMIEEALLASCIYCSNEQKVLFWTGYVSYWHCKKCHGLNIGEINSREDKDIA